MIPLILTQSKLTWRYFLMCFCWCGYY